MKSFRLDLDSMLTVVAAVLDGQGVLLAANAGFLRLLPACVAQPIGSEVAQYFIQPGFGWLRTAAQGAGSDGYRGLLTLGERTATMRTLRGRVWEAAGVIRLLAEYDIADLERYGDALLQMNREASLTQRALTSSNVSLRRREAQIVGESLTDALTGLGNRRRLDQALLTELARVRREGGKLSVLMVDVDHFKRVNDEFGHAVGDQVLVRIGALLSSKTRPTDTVARFGGEELVVLLPYTELAQAMAKAEYLRSTLAAQVSAPMLVPVTASFGVAELMDGEDAATLLRRADAALYRAKDGGRNRVVAASS